MDKSLANTASFSSAMLFASIAVSAVSTTALAVPPVIIAAGYTHSCAVTAGGGVKCWGSNDSGQLGVGGTDERTLAVDVVGLDGVIAVAAGGAHSCALIGMTGTLKCWGNNDFGQLGDSSLVSSNMPVDVVGITGAIAVGAGYQHTCALLGNGAVKCWGWNYSGQLGDGTAVELSTVPVGVLGITDASLLSAGGGYSCVRVGSGSLMCWGENNYGQLGNGNTGQSNVPVVVNGISSAVLLAAGGFHTCASINGGGLKCWGRNRDGELGIGTLVDSHNPVDVTGVLGVTTLASGSSHTCAGTSGGATRCWGKNSSGQLGDGTLNRSTTAVEVSGVVGSTQLSSLGDSTCAVVAAGVIKCWGSNYYGQLGNGKTPHTYNAVSVLDVSAATAIAASWSHTCAVADGNVRCWGTNDDGELGNGTLTASDIPVSVVGVNNATAVAAGVAHSCAIVAGGSVKCWGRNDYGQLGNDTVAGSPVPVDVSNVSGATAVSAGYRHTCALVSGGAVKCWGRNDSGQLGIGIVSNFSATAVDVLNITGAISITSGEFFNCALINDGAVKCWGSNYSGQLGNGQYYDNSPLPVNVTGLVDSISLAAGNSTACAVVMGGDLKCWGENGYGQLGDGTMASSHVPVDVTVVSGSVVSITVGGQSTCSLMANGTAKCWGQNAYGVLGDGTSTITSAAVDVRGVVGATALVAGSFHGCALLNTGRVSCWGRKNVNVLGNGTEPDYLLPQTVIGSPFGDGAAMTATPDYGLLGNGSTANYVVQTTAGTIPTTSLHLTSTPSAALTGRVWSCTAFAGATCPSLGSTEVTDVIGNAILDVTFNLPAWGALRFSLAGIVDASENGFIDLTSQLDDPQHPGGPTSTRVVISAPIDGYGLFKSGFEAVTQ